MVVGVLKEPSFEKRVSMLAETVGLLVKRNIPVWVEKDAGATAFCEDAAYEAAGAQIKTRAAILSDAHLILCIHPPDKTAVTNESSRVFIGVYQPLYHPEMVREWAQTKHAFFSLDMLPRTTRAQSMDVLSSQANIAGYKAVLLAAQTYPRYFPMFMTAAGSITPARVLILGAGVAGLQAIATARRLGAVVEVFDTRPAVKEEVMSLGAKFIDVEGAADASQAGGYAVEQTADYQQKQQQRIAESTARADVVITTAQIPGKKAPLLISAEMIQDMRPGSVIIDLAAGSGGNTPFTRNNETVTHKGITVIGAGSLQTGLPSDASKLYGKNLWNFIQLLLDGNGSLVFNWEDDLVKGACIVYDGKITNEKIAI